MRQGGETIIGQFSMCPQTDGHPAQVAYELTWSGIPSPPGLNDTEHRSWEWEIVVPEVMEGQESFQFATVQ